MDDGSGNRGVIVVGAAEDDDAAAAAAAAALEALVEEECGVVAREHLLSSAAEVVEQHKAKRLEPFAEAAEVCVDEVVALLARRVVVDVARECALDVVEENRLRSVCDEIMDEVIDVPIGVPIGVPTGLIQRVAVEELESFEINSAFEAIYDEVKVEEVQKFLFDVYPAIERTLREKQRQDAVDKVVGRMGKFLFRHTAMRQLSQSAAQRHDDFIRRKNQDVLVHRIMLARLSEVLFANCAYGNGGSNNGDGSGGGTAAETTKTKTAQNAARS